jgi:carboxyl-terminal processing protease
MLNDSRRRLMPALPLLTLLLCPSAWAQPAGDKLELSDRITVAARIYVAVQLYYAHSETVPFPQIESAYRRYIEALVTTPGRREFDLATLRFIAALKNGHTHFRDQWLDSTYGKPLPFWLAPIGDKWVVARTADERLRKGDIVRAINGVGIDDFVEKQVAYIGASNHRIARSWVFYNPALLPERFTLTMEDGRQLEVERGARAQHPVGGKPPETLPAPSSEGHWITEGSIAFIKIPSFGDPGFERTALELVKQYHAAQCLIIDVRGNGGGSTPWQLIRALMDRPWRTWRQKTPQRIALYEAQGGSPSLLELPSGDIAVEAGAFAGRVIFLVDRYTGSAAEDFVMPFKTTGRGLLVGETTQGSTGQPYRLDLGHGMSLMVGSVRCRFPDGAPFEGLGITPDVPVEPTIADLRAGKDSVLLKAEELAGSSQR